MSTFDGIVHEFPSIRIDYFRKHSDKTAPQACFLSHVHSDHLQGLESLKMPFVYCSAATKRILLRMEKYPHRINFAKGILEARKQTYKALKLILRPLPLETPVEIELDPKSKIRVTLFDANHCPGAVMFLIEGSGNAILYTGDVRAEPWWVNSIVRNPILLPYTCGVRKLDCMYLDTTFASREDIYEHFPTKAEGLKELLTKVSKCPRTSTIYFRSWTYGYEDVWITLSNLLQSPVHVDDYQLRIFKALADGASNTEYGPVLAGFNIGNHYQLGCLTDDSTVSIHSCEPGTPCHDDIKKRGNVIWITPIVSRLADGTEIAEIGAGGGGGDLYQVPQMELVDETSLEALKTLCAGNGKYEQAVNLLAESLNLARAQGDSIISLDGLGLEEHEDITLKQFMHLISRKHDQTKVQLASKADKVIHFPFSRHSSFSELRHLVSSFKPRDICPCTVDIESWSVEVSMQSLFGDLCSDDVFRYDLKIRSTLGAGQVHRGQKRKRAEDHSSQETQSAKSLDLNEILESAKTSLPKAIEESQPFPGRVAGHNSTNAKVNNHSTVCPPHQAPSRMHDKPSTLQQFHQALSTRYDNLSIERIQKPAIARALQQNPTEICIIVESNPKSHSTNNIYEQQHSNQPTSPDSGTEATNVSDFETDLSSPTSVFTLQDHDITRGAENDTATDTGIQCSIASSTSSRVIARERAYRAARAALVNGSHDAWNGMRMRSVGWKGHTEPEMEL